MHTRRMFQALDSDTDLSVAEFGDLVWDEMVEWQPDEVIVPYCSNALQQSRSAANGYYRWLACAVRLLNPTHILELGTYRGVSALVMWSEMSANCLLTTIDIDTTMRAWPPEMEADPRVTVVTANDLDIMVGQPLTDGESGVQMPDAPIDFLFMDTVHTCEQLAAEWAHYRGRLSEGALVVVDDISMNDVPRWWNRLPYRKAIEFASVHSTGLGYFFYPGAACLPAMF